MSKAAKLNVAGRARSSLISFPPNTAQRSVLANGLTLIVQEDHTAPIASVQAWCATGSMHEDAHLGAGLSHILEHMLFKGTRTRSTNEIAQKIQDVGGHINAYTSFDRTVFWIDVPKEGVGSALDILSDAMMNSTLPPEEYAKEQDVIRREFAMGSDDPDRVVTQLLFATAFQLHPYRLPVIGLIDIYNQLTQAQVMEYYTTRYAPNNLSVIVVGDVDTANVRSDVEKLFGNYRARALRPIYIPAEPPQLGRREAHNEFATELTHLALAWHVPQVTHPDVPALDLLSVILGEGQSSRLYQSVREDSGLAYSISAFSYTPGEPGLLGVDATLDPANRQKTEELVLHVVDQVRKNGVTVEELAKAKKIALSHEFDSLVTMRGQASDLGTNWFLTRNLNFSRQYLSKIQEVGPEDVQRVTAEYLTDENLTVVSLNPKGSLSNHNRQVLIPSSAGDIQKFELRNGLRLLVREDNRLPLVAISAVFRGGLLAETAETNGITRLAVETLLKGTKTRTAEQIATQLEAVGGEITVQAGNNTFAVNVDMTRPDLALGADILADVLLNATMPSKAVVREKQIQLAKIREADEQPLSVGRSALRAALFSDHPFALRSIGTSQSLERLNSKDLLAFRDRFVVARNGVVAVFGDVEAGEIRDLLEQKLGLMPTGELALTNAPRPRPLSKAKTVEVERDKTQAVLMLGYQGADVFDTDRYALELIDEATSDMGSRLFIRIREDMGLAYFVGAAQVQALVPGVFAFYVGTDPKKIQQVKRVFFEEIEKLIEEGLTKEELARAKKKLVGQQQIANQSNNTFAYMAALDELYGLGFDHYKELEPKVDTVTLADIKRVAAKYFGRQQHALAIVRPPVKPSVNKPK